MNQVEFFSWLQDAPSGLWAFSFFVLIGFLFSCGYFIYSQSNKLLNGMQQTNEAMKILKIELDNTIKEITESINSLSSDHSREIELLKNKIMDLQINTGREIAKLEREVITTASLQRIEIFLESLAARG